MSRKLAGSVRPSPQRFANWGVGQLRCECCGVCMRESALYPVTEGGAAPGSTVPPVTEDVEIEAPVEEARTRKDMPRPYAPTQDEIAKHRVDHLPYRNWCPECVEGSRESEPITLTRAIVARHPWCLATTSTSLLGEYLPGMSSRRANVTRRAESW